MHVLGIDIGGSGVKGAPVDVSTGELLAERVRIATPQPPTATATVEVVAQLVNQFAWKGPIGVGFPGVVKGGTVHTAVNLDKSWERKDAAAMIAKRTGCPCAVTNDADAAGIGEMRFGAGRGHKGVVIVVTLGTGIGTVIFVNGVLVPNVELGHLTLPNGKEAEAYASERAKEKAELPWDVWGKRINEYLKELDKLFWPDLFIIGGGGSKKFEKFSGQLDVSVVTVPALLRNTAGIVGAAAYGAEQCVGEKEVASL